MTRLGLLTYQRPPPNKVGAPGKEHPRNDSGRYQAAPIAPVKINSEDGSDIMKAVPLGPGFAAAVKSRIFSSMLKIACRLVRVLVKLT